MYLNYHLKDPKVNGNINTQYPKHFPVINWSSRQQHLHQIIMRSPGQCEHTLCFFLIPLTKPYLGLFTQSNNGKHEGQCRKGAPVATYLDKQSHIWSRPQHTQPEGGRARTKINMSSNWQQYVTYAGRADTAGSLF